jgi:hypothetical protein
LSGVLGTKIIKKEERGKGREERKGKEWDFFTFFIMATANSPLSSFLSPLFSVPLSPVWQT